MLRDRVFGVAGCWILFATALPVVLAQPSGLERGRLLLQSGQVDQAGRLVRTALEMSPRDPALMCLWGDILFRRAELGKAADAYRSAVESDATWARSYHGLGRIEQAEFRRKNARDLFAKAYRLDPRDPEIILAYADFVSDPQARAVLLGNVAALTKSGDRPPIRPALAGAPPAQLASAYSRYELKLAGFHPTSSESNGLLITASINGGRPLRLILDTGASGILIDNRAARDLHLEPISEAWIGGLGTGGLHAARIALARTVTFGKLELKDCFIEVSDEGLAPGADGIAGANIFERFQIRLDAQSRVLELTPFPEEADHAAHSAQPWLAYDRTLPQDVEHSIPVYGINHLLLVKTRINRGNEGLFLLDTGAAFTSISQDIARQWRQGAAAVPLMGARGWLADAFHITPVELQLAGQPMVDTAPVAFDLRQISQQQGIEISGILGYSLLSKSTLTINYRDGIVRFSSEDRLLTRAAQ